MTETTEHDIFTTMADSLKQAAEACDHLALYPMKGVNYDRLRKHLKIVEGCCRQAGHWRQDARWFPLGMQMAAMHQRVGDWLRGVRVPYQTASGIITIRQRTADAMYKQAAEALRKLGKVAELLRDSAPPKLGMILPEPIAVHRETRPVSTSGLILPSA